MVNLAAPDLPPYVLSLIVVAAGGESKSVRDRLFFAHNAALRYAIEYAGALPSIRSDPRADRTVRKWLDSESVPDDLFTFCARLLDGIDLRVRGRHSRLRRDKGDEPTTFDRSAMLALAQVCHGVAGVRRAAAATVLQTFMALRERHPRELQEMLIENYLGNVLHDFFDSCEVRAEFPKLPVETEHELRVVHGRKIAHALFASLAVSEDPVPASAVQARFRQMIGLIWLAERRLDD